MNPIYQDSNNDMKANMRTIGKWAFTIAAAVVAILCARKGNGVGVIWPIIATILHWAVTWYQELCDELIEANHDNAKVINEIVDANHDLAQELRNAAKEIAELEEEIIKLKQ